MSKLYGRDDFVRLRITYVGRITGARWINSVLAGILRKAAAGHR